MMASVSLASLLLASACFAVGDSTAYRSKITKPNIMFVVADDLGWNDIGYNNRDIFTPTLDSLAREGVILNQSYVQPVCTPTRASFMSGYFPYRLGLQHKVLDKSEPAGLPLNFTLLPQKLKEQGYTTYMVGKWHLGFCKYNYTPDGRGFDHFYGYYNAEEGYYNHSVGGYLDLREDLNPDWNENGTYSTDIFVHKAVQYLTNHNQSKPFYMYLPFQSVHGPIAVPQKYYDMYSFIHDQNRRVKSGMITAMDDAVKAMVAALKKLGFWDNTLFVFTTDNGGPANPTNAGNNWPLRGSKTTLWEGGTRGVAFVRGNLVEKTGYVNNEMIHAVDWFPSLLELVGGKRDPDMDGMNVWNTLARGDPSPRKEFVYNIDEVDPAGEALRMGDYKLILGHAGKPDGWVPPPSVDGLWHEIVLMNDHEEETDYCYAPPTNATYLFNIKDDPTEHFNLADKMPEKVKEMTARLEELKKKLVPAIQVPAEPQKADPRRFGGVWSPGWC
ncbi:arylsulfatase B-like [Ptychodera flava]|uniref:arylsulfatase B-like n=1 Tax=Ptychodera flava TaxID=63121 RepID=UPI003969ED2A